MNKHSYIHRLATAAYGTLPSQIPDTISFRTESSPSLFVSRTQGTITHVRRIILEDANRRFEMTASIRITRRDVIGTDKYHVLPRRIIESKERFLYIVIPIDEQEKL